MEVDEWLSVEGLQPVWLVVDEKVRVLGVVRQVSKCLDVAAHEVHEGQHSDVVVHESHEKRKLCPL